MQLSFLDMIPKLLLICNNKLQYLKNAALKSLFSLIIFAWLKFLFVDLAPNLDIISLEKTMM